MAKKKPLVTDEQWEKIEPLLPPYRLSSKGAGKRKDNRKVFDPTAWIWRRRARRKDLPKEYRSPVTSRRRWAEWEEAFTDGSFAPAKKGDAASARPNAQRVRSGWRRSMARKSRSVLISIRSRRTR